MEITNTPRCSTTSARQLAGPPLLAKIAAGIAVLTAVGALSQMPSLPATTVVLAAGFIAWRLLNLAVTVNDTHIEVRNLLATVRIPKAQAEIRRASTDLRTRTAWGGQFLPKDAVPKMDDDNMRTHARLLRIIDTTDSSRSTHLDCSLGILPPTQDALFARIQAALAS